MKDNETPPPADAGRGLSEGLGLAPEREGPSMSRSKKGGKAPGYEYWGKRPMNGSSPGKWAKTLTHKIERQRNKAKPKDFET